MPPRNPASAALLTEVIDPTPPTITRPPLRFTEYAWIGVVLALIFHIARPGTPQPADYAMAILLFLPAPLLAKGMPSNILRTMVRLAFFLSYVVLCNVGWAAYTGRVDFLVASAQYLFNGLVFFSVIVFLGSRGDAWMRSSYIAFSATLILLVVLSILFPSHVESGRLELFFHNPNQLAYHALLALTIVVVLAPRYKPSRAVIIFLFVCAAYIALKTYSRAGVFSVGLLAALYLGKRPTIIMALALPVLFLVLFGEVRSVNEELWQQRITSAQTASTQEHIENRGLDRIERHPEYLVTGAGEGYFLRFHPRKQEIHSSAANLFFSYGIIGTGLFVFFLLSVVQHTHLHEIFLLTPVFTYSLFHHGMRARPFWILLALVLGSAALTIAERSRLTFVKD